MTHDEIAEEDLPRVTYSLDCARVVESEGGPILIRRKFHGLGGCKIFCQLGIIRNAGRFFCDLRFSRVRIQDDDTGRRNGEPPRKTTLSSLARTDENSVHGNSRGVKLPVTRFISASRPKTFR